MQKRKQGRSVAIDTIQDKIENLHAILRSWTSLCYFLAHQSNILYMLPVWLKDWTSKFVK